MIACILLVVAFFIVSFGKDNRHGSGDDAHQYIFCGGFANIQCPSEQYTCVDDPRDSCNSECSSAADCGGVCVILENSSCGGFAGFSCPKSDQICIDNVLDNCNSLCGGNDCIGTCATLPSSNTQTTSKPQTTTSNHNYQFCGGIANIACPDGYSCVDDPYDDCSTDCGGRDCNGMCVKLLENASCGGLIGNVCPNGYTCIDADGDGCSSLCYGGDCIGICVKPLSTNDDDETIYNCVRRCRKERSQCQNSNKGKQKNSSCLNAFKQCMQSCNP